MARDFAESFYKSARWTKCKDGYMSRQNWMCERCGDIAVICHHKIYLNEDNIHDPEIALNWQLLEALCLDCHNVEHLKSPSTRTGLAFDESGELVKQ